MPRVTKYSENDEPIAGYRLESFLGAGQFGEVWKAVEISTRRLVAIKIIDLSHSNSALKELKALKLVINLNHPNLVPIFTARLKDKNGREIPLHEADPLKHKGMLRELLIVMGLGERSLSARLKDINPDGTDTADFKGIAVDELLGYMQGAARGIDFLNKADHGIGTTDGPIVHCDIKPENMMIVSGEVQIADCGVAVIITPDVRQTKAAGSPAYSAPELTGNKPVPGTDQYALAISYYELRTGHLPFDESMGQLAIMLAHAEGRLEFNSPLITEEELRVLKWATAVRPRERYPTCLDMVKQLERAVDGLQPLEPSQIGVRSGVVQVPLLRRPGSSDRNLIRSTPNLIPESQIGREQHNSNVSFELPSNEDELRGTVIPNSGRLFPTPNQEVSETDPVVDLPLVSGESLSEIAIPANDFTDENPDESKNAPPSPYPPNVTGKSQDVSRPQISFDPDDPMGARAGTVELEPEIADIIKGSNAIKNPGLRLPQFTPTSPTPAVKTKNPSSTDFDTAKEHNNRQTAIPRDTPSLEGNQSLPPWMKEAQAAERKGIRTGSQENTPATQWNKPITNETGGKSGVKLLAGGIIVAGIAAGGAFVIGFNPFGSNSSSVTEKDEGQKKDQTIQKSQNSNEQNPNVDATLIKSIDTLIDKQTFTDLDNAELQINQLPAESHYDLERSRLNNRLLEQREIALEQLKNQIRIIDDLVNELDENGVPATQKAIIADIESKLNSLPEEFPRSIQDPRKNWMLKRDFVRLSITTSTDELATLVNQISKQYDSEQLKKLDIKLVSIGEQKEAYRESIITILTDPNLMRFEQNLPEDNKTTVIRWRVEPVERLAKNLHDKLASLKTGIVDEKTISDLKSTLDKFKKDKEALIDQRPFKEIWKEAYLGDKIPKIERLATLWSDAENGQEKGLSTLQNYLQSDIPPDLAFAMAMEYLRISSEKLETIENLRSVRDYSRKWTDLIPEERQAIDLMFQKSLALKVRNDLKFAKDQPKWNDIIKLCGEDEALGWRTLASAEQQLLTLKKIPDLSTIDSKTTDATLQDRKSLTSYLTALAKADHSSADELVKLYQSESQIINSEFRKQEAAKFLATTALATQNTFSSLANLLDGKWAPFNANPAAHRWIKKAYELDPTIITPKAVQFFSLATANNDATLARATAQKILLDDTKFAHANDLPFALEYYQIQFRDNLLNAQQRISACASATRIAYRLLEDSFPPNQDGLEYEKKILPKIEKLANEGLALSGGWEEDRLSLKLAILRPKIRLFKEANQGWFDEVQKPIEPIARLLPSNHPDLADAYSYRAFVTLMRFLSGDLSQSMNENDNQRQWDTMIADAESALRIDPNNHYGHRVLAIAGLAQFSPYSGYFHVPKQRQLESYHKHKQEVSKADQHFAKATETLNTRYDTTLWATRSYLFFYAANDFAKAGEPTKTVSEMLQDARKSIMTADLQRNDKRIDELRLLGCIEEDLAWLGRFEPAKTFAAASESLKNATDRQPANSPKGDQYFIALGDRARTIIRGVRYGALPRNNLNDAKSLLDQLEREANLISDQARSTATKIEISKAKYWRGILLLVDKKPIEARDAIQEALKTLGNYDGVLYAISYIKVADFSVSNDQLSKADKIAVIENSILYIDAALSLESLKPSFGFAPAYLKAMRARLKGEDKAAAEFYSSAFNEIKQKWEDRKLRVEEPIALQCIANEILDVDLGNRELNARKDLLEEMRTAFAWSLTKDDQDLIDKAMKK